MMKTWTCIAFATLIAVSSAEEKKESVKETQATKRSVYGSHYSYSGLATPVILDTTTGSGYSGHSLVSNYGHGVVLDSYGNRVSYGGGYGTTNTQTKQVPVIFQQYPVQLTKTVAVPQQYPVNIPAEVPKSYVLVPVKAEVPKAHPVTVTKTVPVYVKVPQQVSVKVPQQVSVKVPQQVPVKQQYAVAVPQTVVVKVPGVVGVSGHQYGSVSGVEYTGGDSGTGYGEIGTGFPAGSGFGSGTDYGTVISSGISSGSQIGSQIVSGIGSGSGSGSTGTGYRKELLLNAYLPPNGGYSGYNSYTTKWKHV